MSIKLLLDENLPAKLDKILSAKNWDVKRAPSGASDREIADTAKGEKRIIVTYDKHFADIRAFPPQEFAGIIRLQISPPLISDITSSLEELFHTFQPSQLSGKLIVIRKGRMRIR
jgi:predicted nuclease of predicted toxin-antitoxin system